jgi:16S rRNA processing protein RimM
MDLIAVGRISKPIGTRGEVKIFPLTHDKHRFSCLSDVWLGNEAAKVELKKIVKVRIDAKQVVLNFDGIDTVEEAEKIRDLFLFVPKEDAVKLRDGSYFVDDVIGCEVVTEEQMAVGVITDLLSLPMNNDLWVVKKGAKEVLIPVVKAIVRQVDVKNKRITIHALDGLLD